MILSALASLGAFAAWCGHTAVSAAYAADFDAALSDTGLTRQEASVRMGLDVHGNELSKMLKGLKPINAYRVEQIGPEFKVAFSSRQLARLGASVVTARQRDFLLAIATVGRRRMARLLPQLVERRHA